jgi:hypothetical protein
MEINQIKFSFITFAHFFLSSDDEPEVLINPAGEQETPAGEQETLSTPDVPMIRFYGRDETKFADIGYFSLIDNLFA